MDSLWRHFVVVIDTGNQCPPSLADCSIPGVARAVPCLLTKYAHARIVAEFAEYVGGPVSRTVIDNQ
jgi:hypothetical protein